jgi:hypothetical protein
MKFDTNFILNYGYFIKNFNLEKENQKIGCFIAVY